MGIFVSCYDDSELVERIDALENNVNEQIAAIKASITALESVDKELKAAIKDLESKDASLQEDLDKLKVAHESLENKIEELKSWIDDLLKGYYTSVEIDESLKSLKDSLVTLQEKLNNIQREFAITFDDVEIEMLPGSQASINYTIIGATDSTIVRTICQNGWVAKVIPKGNDKGEIIVTAPNPMIDDDIIVLVYDGEYRTIMNTINLVKGVVSLSETAVNLGPESSTINVDVTSNMIYKIAIPEDAKEWLSVVNTRVMTTKTISFICTENGFKTRCADVAFLDEANNVISSMAVVQKGWTNKIHYTTTDDQPIELGKYGSSPDFGAQLLSNTYSEGLGVLKFSGDVIKLEHAFLECTNLKTLELPETIKDISYGAFQVLPNLEELNIPEGVEYIAHRAIDCLSIKSITIPSTVTKIDEYAFAACDIENFYGSFATEDNKAIIYNDILISGAKGITTYTVPEGVKKIGTGAFEGADLQKIIFPNTLEVIGEQAFPLCPLEGIALPESCHTIGGLAFHQCKSLKTFTANGKIDMLDSQAISSCDLLQSITFNEGVGVIYGITDNPSLTRVYINYETPPSTDSWIDASAEISFFVPKNAVQAYKDWLDAVSSVDHPTGSVVGYY